MKIGYCDIINITGIDFYKDVGKDLYFYKDAIRMENTGLKRLPTESELESLSKSPYVIKDEYCYFANNLLDLNDENKCLKLPLSGYCFDSIINGVGQSAFFWSKSKKTNKRNSLLGST